MDDDGEAAGDDLEPQRACVAGWAGLETVGAVGQQAGEDVETTGRTLGVGADPVRQRLVDPLEEWDEVALAALEDGTVAQVDRVLLRLLEALLNSGRLRQESCPDAPGGGAESEVEARGLDLAGLDRRSGRRQCAVCDQPFDVLVDENPGHGQRPVRGVCTRRVQRPLAARPRWQRRGGDRNALDVPRPAACTATMQRLASPHPFLFTTGRGHG